MDSLFRQTLRHGKKLNTFRNTLLCYNTQRRRDKRNAIGGIT